MHIAGTEAGEIHRCAAVARCRELCPPRAGASRLAAPRRRDATGDARAHRDAGRAAHSRRARASATRNCRGTGTDSNDSGSAGLWQSRRARREAACRHCGSAEGEASSTARRGSAEGGGGTTRGGRGASRCGIARACRTPDAGLERLEG